MRLILASASPRRAELLTSAGYTFEIAPADVDETPGEREDPRGYALRVARDKARAASAGRTESSLILAADTIVVQSGEILGKPRDAADSTRMLSLLAGQVHEVHTAVVIGRGSQMFEEVATTRVSFAPMTADEIAWYVRSGEPAGKAGAYGIQGRAARFVDHIEGSWSNVVGLPMATVYRLLNTAQKGYSERVLAPQTQ